MKRSQLLAGLALIFLGVAVFGLLAYKLFFLPAVTFMFSLCLASMAMWEWSDEKKEEYQKIQ